MEAHTRAKTGKVLNLQKELLSENMKTGKVIVKLLKIKQTLSQTEDAGCR